MASCARARAALPSTAHVSMALLGAAILTPWFTLLNALPFIQSFFEDERGAECISFFLALAYSIPGLPLALLLLCLPAGGSAAVSPTVRVIGSSAVAAALLLLLPIIAESPTALLLTAVVFSLEANTLQSTLFACASSLPPEFSQTLVLGQGLAGVASSFAEILFKATSSGVESAVVEPPDVNDYASAWTLFIYGAAVMVGAAFLFTRVVLAAETEAAAGGGGASGGSSSEESPDAAFGGGGDAHGGALEDGQPLLAGKLPRPSSAQDVTAAGGSLALARYASAADGGAAPSRRSLLALAVARGVPLTALFCVLSCTMMLFPAVLLDTPYRGSFGPLKDVSWWTTLLLLFYNLSDVGGRFTASQLGVRAPNDIATLSLALARFALVPLLVLTSRGASGFGDAAALVLTIALGFSNGALQSFAIGATPGDTKQSERASVGNLISLVLNLGIVLGGAAALGVSPLRCV